MYGNKRKISHFEREKKKNPCNCSEIDDYLKDYRNLFPPMLMRNDGISRILKIHSAQTNKFWFITSHEKIPESETGYVQQTGNRANHSGAVQVFQLLFRLTGRQKINSEKMT